MLNYLRLTVISVTLVKIIWIINHCFWLYMHINPLGGNQIVILIQTDFCIGIILVYLVIEQILFVKYIKNLRYKIAFMLVPFTFLLLIMKKKIIISNIDSFSKIGLYILSSLLFTFIFIQMIFSIIGKFEHLSNFSGVNDHILIVVILPISFGIGFQMIKHRMIKKDKNEDIKSKTLV